jgi:predicted nucleic acid-binding Zn ribbon protein
MPVYVYKNLDTGEMFELRQPITEPALSVHPETGAPVKRVVQPVGITFKGSGFYVTDSRKAKGDKVEGEGKPKAEKKAKSEGKSDPVKKSD